MSDLRYPNETKEYRDARDALKKSSGENVEAKVRSALKQLSK